MRRWFRLLLCVFKQPLFWLRKSRVHFSTFIGSHTLLISTSIGKYCYVGRNVIINSAKIGNYVSIASNVQIGGMEHCYWYPSQSTWLSNKSIIGKITIIEHDVWIGAGSIIKQGIKVGQGAVVGANTCVTKDVPPYAIVVGSPAKILKYRFDERMCTLIYESNFWNYPPSRATKILKKIDAQYK